MGRAISIRKLAAIDMALLGSKFILAEFAVGVFGSIALGLFVLFRSLSSWQIVLGVYLISLGVNYAPLLGYAIEIACHRSARAEVADELAQPGRSMSRYRRYSLLLLLPLVVPFLAAAQELGERKREV